VPHRLGLVERLDAPADRSAGERIGLIVTGHQHRGVMRRPQLEREVACFVDVEIVVTHDRHDPIGPGAGRRFVVRGHREVHAVALLPLMR
jgi:hypothetical protein